MLHRPSLVRRRTVLGGLAATVLVAGCDSGEDIEPPGSGASGTPQPSEAVEQSPDEALVEEVADAILAAMAVLAGARRKPPLRTAGTPLLRAHREHLEVLEAEERFTPVGGEPVGLAAALREIRRSEGALHATLVAAAGRAESGALARLLASMSASVTQHLAVLPREVAR